MRRDGEHEWPHNHRRKDGRAGTQVVEHAEYASVVREIERDLLVRLARDGFIERTVSGFSPSTGERDVSAPRVTLPFGALHEQQFQRVMESDSKEQRSEEHTSELQSLTNLVCRLLLEK